MLRWRRSVGAQPYYIFRGSHDRLPVPRLIDGLAGDIASGRYVDALVRAGEIESALSDEGSEIAASASDLTDALGSAIVGMAAEVHPRLIDLAVRMRDLRCLEVAAPEAFSYYGLDPRDVAAALGTPPLDAIDRACVVGVRSIGTTMSAVAAAALRARGGEADRCTVRPAGSPFDRRTALNDATVGRMRGHAASGSEVIVIDEGPGLSGSSILSVVDALVGAGVPRDRVRVLCTRIPDPASLLAPDGARRWADLRVTLVPRQARFPAGWDELGPDAWRRRFLRPHRWPASSGWTERPKALDAEGRRLRKWEGLGRHGGEARTRAEALGDAGFGPRARRGDAGCVDYALVDGVAAAPSRIGSEALERLADYCAWRAVALRAPSAPSDLAAMIRRNGELAFGRPLDVDLVLERPVVPDARTMPHEWIVPPAGPMLKIDASLHGDDHLWPGPCDVAWDLAGTIVEWRMGRDAAAHFLGRYARRSGDDPARRLPGWLLAYAVHRVAVSEFSSQTAAEPERARFRREAARYRRWIARAAAAGVFDGLSRDGRIFDSSRRS